MATGLWKFEKGKRIAVSYREAKAFIMKEHGWTADQYQKNYDIFKNKLRAKESYEREVSRERVTPQSPVSLLYAQAKSMAKYGKDYEPTLQMKRIEAFSAVSITKGRQLAKQEAYQQRRAKTYEQTTNTAFANLLEKNQTAKRIYESIENPVLREKALADFADKLRMKVDILGRFVDEGEAIPADGERQGSDIDIYFDISPYLD